MSENKKGTDPDVVHIAETAFNDMMKTLVGRIIVGVIPDTDGQMTIMYDREFLENDDPVGYIDLIIKHLRALQKSVCLRT